MPAPQISGGYGYPNPTETVESFIASGTISLASNAQTTEVKTSAISLLGKTLHPEGMFVIQADRTNDATVGTVTLKAYNVNTLSATGTEVLAQTFSLANATTGTNPTQFVAYDLGHGTGTIKLSATGGATSATGVTVTYWIGRCGAA